MWSAGQYVEIGPTRTGRHDEWSGVCGWIVEIAASGDVLVETRGGGEVWITVRRLRAARPVAPAAERLTRTTRRTTMTIDRSKVIRVYHGKAGKCCCGCAGNYSTNPATVTRAIRFLERTPEVEESSPPHIGGERHICADVGNRRVIVYLRAD